MSDSAASNSGSEDEAVYSMEDSAGSDSGSEDEAERLLYSTEEIQCHECEGFFNAKQFS